MKVDLKKDLKQFYGPAGTNFSLVNVPAMNFLQIDGQGNPNTAPAYREAVEALYALAYYLKFSLKKGPAGADYVVMPLEGLWWADDMSQFTSLSKDSWKWTMMIMQPEAITPAMFAEAVTNVGQKKNLPALPLARLEPYHEGLTGQVLYIGAYADEGPTIARLHDFIHEQGCQLRGKHHEIYLGDPRKVAPEKLKTIIRQPCARMSTSS